MIGIRARKVGTVHRQLLAVVLALCVVTSVCRARSRHSGRSDRYRSDKYRRTGSGSPSEGSATLKPLVGYNPGVERSKFFTAAGKDSELDEKEYKSSQSKGSGFVRKTDSWSAMLRYDKDRNRTIDWFEADAYRRAQHRAATAQAAKSGSGSSSKAASTSKSSARYNPAVERNKFFAAAGKDSELDEKEFKSNQSKGGGFVRRTDSWSTMLRYDKDGNRTIDWFEADAYRRSRDKTAIVKVAPAAEASFGGHRYKVFKRRVSWEDAKAECEALGGHLVTIESSDELAFVKKLAGSSRLWVGATDRSDEGKWVWIGGKPVPQGGSMWASGEPNGGKACNYASITSRGLYDSSSPYASVFGLICELDK